MIRIVAACMLAACSTDDGGPRLDAVMPTSVPAGGTAVVTGTRFCGAGGDCSNVAATLALGAEPPMVDAQIEAYSDTSAMFIVPRIGPVGPTQLILTVGDQSSNALALEVLPTP